MDETPFGFAIFAFILYWIFIKDPESPDDRKLDEQTRNNLLLFSGVVIVYTLHKSYNTGAEGIQEFTSFLMPNSSDNKEEILENAIGSDVKPNVKKEIKIPSGTISIENAIGAPHVLEGRKFFSSATTTTEITSSADS